MTFDDVHIWPVRLWIAVLFATAGCQAVAPIHVWSPPEVASAVGKKVAISPLAGPQPIAEEIETYVYQSAPRDQARAVEAITSDVLRSQQAVRLASASENMPSDLALLPAARQQGIDFLLMGEVLADRSLHPPRLFPADPSHDSKTGVGSNSNAPTGSADPNPYQEQVSIAWRVYDVAEARPLADRVVVSGSGASNSESRTGEALVGEEKLSPARASGRAVWRLLSPSVRRDHVSLAVPWLLPGSKAVRRGNELARNGRWPEAEQLWRQTLEQHPYQHAAQNNLAIAAAARQDFSTARRLIREAIGRRSDTLYEENLVWIEIRQRDYHAAFGLPDPPEGWFLTATSAQTP